jgi:hypothetical protein
MLVSSPYEPHEPWPQHQAGHSSLPDRHSYKRGALRRTFWPSDPPYFQHGQPSDDDNVTSAARLASKHSSRKPAAFSRSTRYSARYLPAWRISHSGGMDR